MKVPCVKVGSVTMSDCVRCIMVLSRLSNSSCHCHTHIKSNRNMKQTHQVTYPVVVAATVAISRYFAHAWAMVVNYSQIQATDMLR